MAGGNVSGLSDWTDLGSGAPVPAGLSDDDDIFQNQEGAKVVFTQIAFRKTIQENEAKDTLLPAKEHENRAWSQPPPISVHAESMV